MGVMDGGEGGTGRRGAGRWGRRESVQTTGLIPGLRVSISSLVLVGISQRVCGKIDTIHVNDNHD